jgi:Short C-terminal domain
MLFLYRPRQTWMPYRLSRRPTEQAAYNRQLQDKFDATHRVAPPAPAAVSTDGATTGGPGGLSSQDVTGQLKDLAQLHAAGALNDNEFATAKAKVLETVPGGP